MSANSRKRLRQSYLTTPSQQIARGGFSFFVWGLSLLIIPFCIYFIGPLWGWSIGTVIWMEAFAQSFHLFVVSVPEVTGLITLNYFVRPTPIDPYTNLHVYPPGLSFKFPWEQVKEGLYINLRIVTLTFFEDFSTKSSPSKVTVRQTEKDGSFTHKTKTLRSKAGAGPKVTVRGEVQYRAILELLPRYIAVAEESILEGLLNIIRSDLAIEVAQTLPEKVRSEIKEAQKRLTELFRDPDQLIRAAREIQMAEQLAPGEVKDINIEWLYAIDVFILRISDVEYETEYQRVLTSGERNKRLGEIADQWSARGLNPKDASNAALIVNGTVPKQVVEVEGNAGQALQALLLGLGSLDISDRRQTRRPSRSRGQEPDQTS